MAKRSGFKRLTKSVTVLHLDPKNPRLGQRWKSNAPKDIIQFLFDNDRAFEVAESIALLGYFPTESLLVIEERGKLVVVEGNRRLAALKALHNPDLLNGPMQSKVRSQSNGMRDHSILSAVPIVIAPNRRATDQTVAGRHIGQATKPWQAENRASFIIEKIEDGYTVDKLRDDLGFTLVDIQKAKQTKAIADMSRALPITDDKAKAALDSERPGIFSTIERVFDSKYARQKLFIEPDAEHGFVVRTSKPQFEKAMVKLVTDIARKDETSRSLNNEESIKKYFAERWKRNELPQKKQRTTYPSDMVGSNKDKLPPKRPAAPKRNPVPRVSTGVLPRRFKPRHGNKRIKTIADELRRLKRYDYPNAGAVLLRVFIELAIRDYLTRSGAYDSLCKRLKQKDKLSHGHPQMKDLVTEVLKDIKQRLPKHEADLATKALMYNSSARFTVSELHSFVHNHKDIPTGHDLEQFWERMNAAMEMMLIDDLPMEIT